MYYQPARRDDSIGYGLVGCTGGLLLGLIGGSLVLVVMALLVAVVNPASLSPPANEFFDLRLTLHENFINQLFQSSLDETARVDVLPGGRLLLTVDASGESFGIPLQLELSGLFELRLQSQTIQVELLETRVAGLTLPPQLQEFFNDMLQDMNTNFNTLSQDIAAELGRPVILTGLGSDDTTLWFEASEMP